MHPSVRAAFIPFSTPREGRIPYMYLDILGKVTTGIGDLIDSPGAASELSWVHKDMITPAKPHEIEAAWNAVHARKVEATITKNNPKGLVHTAFEGTTTLRLTEAEIERRTLMKLAHFETELKKTPEFADLETWPADAQLGLLSMAWAMGPYFGGTWVHSPTGWEFKGRWSKFREAIRTRQWTGGPLSAAEQCFMPQENVNRGLVSRNIANRALFDNADRVVREGRDPSVLLYEVKQVPAPTAPATGKLPGRTDLGYFAVGDRVAIYDLTRNSGVVRSIPEMWGDLGAIGFDARIDAAVDLGYQKLFAFKGKRYIRVSFETQRVDAGYPLDIAGLWPGFAECGFVGDIDAAVNWGTGKAYFFKGGLYIRYDIATDRVDPGYPRPICEGWHGVDGGWLGNGFSGAIYPGGDRAYFFKHDEYIAVDWSSKTVLSGYPRKIGERWPGLAESGFSREHTAVWSNAPR